VLFAIVPWSASDVIHLKNGQRIWADHVREDKTRIEYEVGESSFAIPKSAVLKVETGGVAPQNPASGGAAHDVPDFTPVSPSFSHEADVAGKVIRDGKVDSDTLGAIERGGNAELSATAYFLAGKHEGDHGNYPQATRYFETALRFQPTNSTLLIYYAATLLRTGHADQAMTYAQRAADADPESADALAMLGFTQFANDRTTDAIRSWKKSLKIRPDAVVSQYLARAERETNVESQFALRESTHFTLHFEGKQTSQSFPHDVLATLEQLYDELSRDLEYTPHNSIVVTLYTEQAFFDVTQAPSWTSAINDGKLRIPIRGMSTVTPELARVLKHELTHSFVGEMSAHRCPTWLHEGIAQAEEGKSNAAYGPLLAQLFAGGQELPLNALEGSFMSFSAAQATVAYAESLAAVEFMRDRYSMDDVSRILTELAQGKSTEVALRSVIHSDYRQLRDDLARWLKDKYGQ
jgi:tetratricopeptide (TPR) repeat protein